MILSLLILETTHKQHWKTLPHDMILSTFLVLNRNSVATQHTHQSFTCESGVVVVTIHGHTQHDLLQSSLLILNTLQEFLSGLLIIVNVKKQEQKGSNRICSWERWSQTCQACWSNRMSSKWCNPKADSIARLSRLHPSRNVLCINKSIGGNSVRERPQ